MSAQAASALRAVKASQAEKGQAVLARTRKQAAETHLDDDSLIRIAAEMPVDDDALVEFSTERPLEDKPRETDAPLPAMAAASDETSPAVDTSSDRPVTPEPAPSVTETTEDTVPAKQTKPTQATPPPPQLPVKRTAVFQPALVAGLLFAALLLGYYFWPESDGNSAVVATQEGTAVEATATMDEPVGTQDATTSVATVPPVEPGQEPTAINNDWTPSDTPDTWESSSQPQTAAIPAAAKPEPKSEPAPVESVPVVATQPAQPAQPAVPAQPERRPPAQGYYPQQRRPSYPQYYYR